MTFSSWGRLRSAVVLLLVLGFSPSSTEGAVGTQPFADFDRSRIAPAPRGTHLVARVFDRYVTLDDVGGKSASAQERTEALVGVVWKEITDRYAADQALVVPGYAVERFVLVLSKRQGMPVDDDMRAFARAMVLQWRLDQSLYRRYGGTVVWQQLSPQQPVGAYRALLAEMEERGILEIHDRSLRNAFWEAFEVNLFFEVPSANVDFEVPWWLRDPEGPIAAATNRTNTTLVTAGHEIQGATARFLFDPKRFEQVTHGQTGEWRSLANLHITTVHIAGDFNGWSPLAWPMRPVGPTGSRFLLERPLTDLGASGNHRYKFLINGVWWVKPPHDAGNRVTTGLTNASGNLVITVP